MFTRLTICSLYIFDNLSRIGFEGGIRALIAPVPGLAILVTIRLYRLFFVKVKRYCVILCLNT